MDMDIIDDKFIDIHNHLIHEVDDGSKNIEMSKELLKIFYNQGVKILFLTPHLNSPSSKTNFSEINKNFRLIKEIANKIGIKCYLGYEIYIPFYLPKINFSDYTMGNSNVLLLEFSHYDDSPIKEHVYNLIKRGFRIIIAHIERYDYLDLYDIFELKDMGVYLQVNASSIIEKKK
jgi:protein-tyrosine phosphatase